MNDETGVQIVGARSKRTHRQMSHESSEGSSRSWRTLAHYSPESSTSRPTRLPHIRTSRDGYDLRSPAQESIQQEAVIDLTDEPETPPQRNQPQASGSGHSNSGRLPRFGRNILANIVDLANDEEETPHDLTGAPSSSPEVQFVGSTTRRQPLPSRASGSIGRSLAPLGHRHHMHDNSMFPFFSSVTSFLGGGGFSARQPPDLETFFLGQQLDFPAPFDDLNNLDYASASFSLGSASQQGASSRRNDYKPPDPAPQGFTRTLGEDDVAVCPNCYWELGTGEGKKQEIWVAKPCGHVYCGECSENRSLSKAKKTQGPSKTKPFSKCQILECGKSVSAPTAMIHLYL